MIKEDELKRYESTYSAERLSSFAYSEFDTIQDVVTNYKNNIQISQAIYPELCTLEVILRNSINNILKKYISETWIEDEINNNVLLDASEYKTLLKAYNDTKDECITATKVFTIGKVVANLNFGFWTNLCVKKYNSKIWNKPKCFYGVFVNYPNKHSINYIAKKLYTIRRFRNRVFHYEKIFKYPNRTLSVYNDILEMLSFLTEDKLEILKQTSTFLNTYNSLMQKAANEKT
ncbi:putative uncharacterized protein [Brachyspira sp. CAG:484]|nr:putative uncharacterized protein [Brachyspira sp. CAG:484]